MLQFNFQIGRTGQLKYMIIADQAKINHHNFLLVEGQLPFGYYPSHIWGLLCFSGTYFITEHNLCFSGTYFIAEHLLYFSLPPICNYRVGPSAISVPISLPNSEAISVPKMILSFIWNRTKSCSPSTQLVDRFDNI